ncbi:MAG: ATP-grasp domain-containing protein [Clostridia bacterium]|nr:ATP-grasp domain-containing protein [Clostridia bacterium]
MKNFIFTSPNFPTNYWKFCRELKNNGFNVLGIGDCPYDNLAEELKSSLTEYYWVHSLKNYDEVYRAVAYFIHGYGRIDFLESNNEYCLEQDARLRTDFNITSGFRNDDMDRVKCKSQMKKYYRNAGIVTARYCMATSIDECRKFIKEVGYPVIVKPDNGVGANDTYKLSDDDELEAFFRNKPPFEYIMEEFVDAEVNSYDAIIDSHGYPIFETGNVTPYSIMDIVNNNSNSVYYMVNELAPDVRDAGRRTVKSFGVRSRFVHFEFFRLTSDQYLGKKGDVIALEVNMRPCGGFSPDMMNYANSTDVYKIWADMITYDSSLVGTGERYYCGYAGRRDGKRFVYSDDEITNMYKDNLKAIDRIPEALSAAMGNIMYLATFKTKEELDSFYRNVLLTEEI